MITRIPVLALEPAGTGTGTASTRPNCQYQNELPVPEVEVLDAEEDAVLAAPERDLRIETWPKRGKNGRITRYWQWCERGASIGKRGGKRWRAYGGSFSVIPEAIKSKHYRQGRKAK